MKREMPDPEFHPAKRRKIDDWATEEAAFGCFDSRVSKVKTDQLKLVKDCVELLRKATESKGFPLTKVSVLQQAKSRVDAQLSQILRPFTIAVLGSFNTGKSTLINAMFGKELCKTGVVVCTDKIKIISHSPSENDIKDPDVVYQYCDELNKLLEVNIVDTPGLNALPKFKHSSITTNFLPNADLALVVSCPDKLINKSDAQFLEIISKWKSPIIFVLNKIDHCNDHEIETCVDFIQNHATEYFEKVMVLPVSAKMYYTAKKENDEEKMKQSRFQQLLCFISDLHRGRMWFLKAMGPVEKCISALSTLSTSLEQLDALIINDRKGIEELNKAIETLMEVEVNLIDVQDAQRSSDEFFDENFNFSSETIYQIATSANLANLHYDKTIENLKKRILEEAGAYSDSTVNKLNGRMKQLLKKLPHEFSELTRSIFQSKAIDLHLAEVHELRDLLLKEVEKIFDKFLETSPAIELNTLFSSSFFVGGSFAGATAINFLGMTLSSGIMGTAGSYILFRWRFGNIRSNCRSKIGKLGVDLQSLFQSHTEHIRSVIRTNLNLLIEPISMQISEIEQTKIVQKRELSTLNERLTTMKSDLESLLNSSDLKIPTIEELVEQAKRKSMSS